MSSSISLPFAIDHQYDEINLAISDATNILAPLRNPSRLHSDRHRPVGNQRDSSRRFFAGNKSQRHHHD